MAGLLQKEKSLLPITALAFVGLGGLYLLAGEGEYLKIFHHKSKKLLRTQHVFESQAIHGIVCHSPAEAEDEQALLLIWGGRSVCLLDFQNFQIIKGELQIKVVKHVPEIQLDDRILDGCFQDLVPSDSNPKEIRFDALLVTAHNELHMLSGNTEKSEESKAVPILSRIASGARSILYSAHVICLPNSRVLVAAGTVFGEVLLWSYHADGNNADGVSALCHKFLGHEGSVFSVRISEPQQSGIENGVGKRVLASCSDDRTIRIWDINQDNPLLDGKDIPEKDKVRKEAGFPNKANPEYPTGCLAVVMGHASRIWGVRFLGQGNDLWGILSHGEDGTAQVWRLNSEALRNSLVHAISAPILDLKHEATHSFHSGKNLWGIAEHFRPSGMVDVATGGADGRIATYKLECRGSDSRSSQCTMVEASRILGMAAQGALSVPTSQPRTITRRIFDSLQGQWRLSRRIESRSSEYPSGYLEGTATFKSRLPSDEAFSAEYLYSEGGDFVTQNGLVVKATRKYVYRYNTNRDSITVWFVKVDDGSAVDYFFHDLYFGDLVEERHPWAEEDTGIDLFASGHHLCDKDDYAVEYLFVLGGSIRNDWTINFNVHGPKKDYTTKATYTSRYQQNAPRVVNSMTSATKSVHSSTVSAVSTDKSKHKKSLGPHADSLKAYAWLSENEFLTSTERGNLLVGTMNTRQQKPEDGSKTTWEHVSQQPLLSSSCIATSIVPLGICLLTGMDGTVFLYKHSSRSIEAIYSLIRKAGFLKGHKLSKNWSVTLPRASEQAVIGGVVATCVGASEATALILCTQEGSSVISVEKEYTLELPADFLVTSSCFVDRAKMVVLGSRSGELAIYSLTKVCNNAAGHNIPCHIPRMHGHDAVTAIEVVSNEPFSAYRSCIITAGRNGSYGVHQILFDELYGSDLPMKLQPLHIGVPPISPNVEGICVDVDDLYLWGFRGREFVVWNETQKTEVMTADCGGAHRNWSYHHHRDGNGGGSFVYTKASVCHLHSQKQAFHRVVQQGGHGREIKALALSPSFDDADGRELQFLATGAEDTAIRIFDARSSVEGSKCLSAITKHTTGLQKLQWSPDGRFLFSAAGCEVFFVWTVQTAPLVTIGLVCEAQCLRVTEEADLRIMDFAILTMQFGTTDQEDETKTEPDYLITMVYSDSSIRVFRYNTIAKSFVPLFFGTYTTYCLTQATYLHLADGFYICTASTDGHLTFWSLPLKIIEQDIFGIVPRLISTNFSSACPTTITHSKTVPVHKNAIKSMITIPLPQYEHLIMTGGDDGAIAFTPLRCPMQGLFTCSTLLIPKAHASAVTAVAHLGEVETVDARLTVKHRFASVGNDQRLKTWLVEVDLAVQGAERVRVVKESNVGTSIADVSSLEVGVDREGLRSLHVAGIGMESWRVGDALMEKDEEGSRS